MTDTKHTNSVETAVHNIVAHILGTTNWEADTTFIENEIHATLKATHQQQVEEAVEAEKKRILDELWRLVEWHRQEKNQMFGIVSANTTINALHQARGIVRGDNHASASNTPNHQD